MNEFALLALASGAVLSMTVAANAQGVPPRWNHLGSAVCPNGYDYFVQFNQCLPRGGGGYYRGGGGGYYGGGGGYARGGGVPPRWNRAGSAVCPQHYDFYANRGLCLPRY